MANRPKTTDATGAATLAELADQLGGRIVHTDDGGRLALPDGGVLYVNFQGKVRLQRYGQPVADLGMRTEGAATIAAKCCELMAGAS